jgi:hypothetical protein
MLPDLSTEGALEPGLAGSFVVRVVRGREPHRRVGSGWKIWDGGVMSWRATDLAEDDARSRRQTSTSPLTSTGNATEPIAEKSARRSGWSQPPGLLQAILTTW